MRTLLFILILPLKVGNCLGGQSYKNVGTCRETILDGSISDPRVNSPVQSHEAVVICSFEFIFL